MSEQEPSNVISLDKYGDRRARVVGQPRVWRVDGNPADALRGRFITADPRLLKVRYAPRTSGSKGKSGIHTAEDEPIA
ncbi:hypothetical protein A3C26_03200 [Candidatus Daviesbacteria bacterium RIFCSPHIGHO2_02_FULL_39_12]|uniref:Uncharacterized protein n=2 Tax=Candidatus Daviesiibacteriota TaxID=1752718 RepID=A0A1F5JDP1_9BACT|nr:MAG: hypothetical protein A3C26_03200 [Candidatus Daviesbacteria bacterium RIFCSPHIGHO2_02_FULL_39_12]OGE71891.1 MAG: hypothetical protein A3H40_03355 [Candidatus Daviesbacteria bacterium RIFCSPLOWO2_02_FULL_38_15]